MIEITINSEIMLVIDNGVQTLVQTRNICAVNCKPANKGRLIIDVGGYTQTVIVLPGFEDCQRVMAALQEAMTYTDWPDKYFVFPNELFAK